MHSNKIFICSNATCSSWAAIRNGLYNKAKEYLTERKKVLNRLVSKVGYKTCHHLNSLDATVCANDCKEMERGKFAKNCTANGGLFKCCIRRDKMACHECRYCCTLPMCTYSPGYQDSTIFNINQSLELKNQKNTMSASDLFFSSSIIGNMREDYYCIKPDSHKNPKKWRRYDMIGYRQAFNKTQLKKTATFKFDKYLYNMVDPKIFKDFTKNKKKGRKLWKNTYGIPYVNSIQGNKSDPVNLTSCVEKCVKMEKSQFAKKCKKIGGYFKCCVTFWNLKYFEIARNQLVKDKLVEDKISLTCNKKSNPCDLCSTNGICTKRNPLNDKRTHFYFPKMKKGSEKKGKNLYILRK